MLPLLSSLVWLSISMCFNVELVIPASVSSIFSKWDDKSPSICFNNLIIADTFPRFLLCSISIPAVVDNRPSWKISEPIINQSGLIGVSEICGISFFNFDINFKISITYLCIIKIFSELKIKILIFIINFGPILTIYFYKVSFYEWIINFLNHLPIENLQQSYIYLL